MIKPKSEEHGKVFGTDKRVIALAIARMADSLGNSFLVVVLPLYIASGQVHGDLLGLSNSLVTGVVLGLFGLVSSFCQPFTGRLSDRHGKRKLFVVAGLALFTLINFSFIVAHSYAALIAIRVVQGVAAALTITASLALVSELSHQENRGSNLGVYNSFRLVGFGLGPLASGALIQAGPYNIPLIGTINGFIAAFCVAGFAALLSLVLVSLLVADPAETKPSKTKMVIRFKSRERGRVLDPIFTLGISTLIMSTGFALLASIEPQINERLSQTPFTFSLQFASLIVILAIVQPWVGKASDKYGRKIFILTGLICLVPITFLEGFVTQSWHLILARGVQGISAAMVFAPSLALAGDLAEEGQVGSQLSVVTVAFGIGISFGAFLSGYAIRFGFSTPFVVGSVLAALGAVLVYTQVPGRKQLTPAAT